MNILLVNSFYYPNMIGGAEHSVKLLAENLVKAGHSVSVYSLDANPQMAKPLQIDIIKGVKIFRGYNKNFTQGKHFSSKKMIDKIICRATSIYNHTIKSDLNYICTLYTPDVVHTNNIYGISTYVWKYFYKKNIKIVHTIRDYFLYDPKARIGGSHGILLWGYQKYFRKQSCKYVDVVTAPSKFTLDKFCVNGYFINAKKQCVVNSISFDPSEIKTIVNKKLQRTDQRVTFIFVGALTHDKGVDNLIEAFSLTHNGNIRLNICGKGPLKELVKKYEKKDKRISYLGQLNSDDLRKAYIAADVLIAPSVWDEPFGRVIIEGNQYGLAIIGSNRAGIAEILKSMNSGEEINPDSISEIALAIERFSTRSHYKKYLENIISNLFKYSIELQVDDFLKLYL